ncbi:MAG: hypothetical protein ACI3YC_06320 [Alloprevotella sp.]
MKRRSGVGFGESARRFGKKNKMGKVENSSVSLKNLPENSSVALKNFSVFEVFPLFAVEFFY